MKIKVLNEDIAKVENTDKYFSTEEEEAAERQNAGNKNIENDENNDELIDVKVFDQVKKDHQDNTSWADECREYIEAAGMKEAKEFKKLDDVLDWYLYVNLMQKEDAEIATEFNLENGEQPVTVQPVNLLILGQPGTGKSAIIEAWFRKSHVRGVKFTGGQLRQSVIQGLPYKTEIEVPDVDTNGNPRYNEDGSLKTKIVNRQSQLGSTIFDILDTENGQPSVLFIDEINRSMIEAESAILTLVQSKTIPDSDSITGERKFKDFLFTIAAANPSGGEGDDTVRKLSLALKTRFDVFFQEANIEETGEYLLKKFQHLKKANLSKASRKNLSDNGKILIERDDKGYQGKINILQALIDANIEYSTPEEGKAAANNEECVFNARTLEKALVGCDGTVGEIVGEDKHHGVVFTPKSFLEHFKASCGTAKLEEVMAILDPVKEAEDVANGFLNTYAEKYEAWKKRFQRNMA